MSGIDVASKIDLVYGAASAASVPIPFGVTTHVLNAYTVALNATPAALVSGDSFIVTCDNTNTGASTLDAGIGGVKNLYKNNAALIANDFVANNEYMVVYDGTQYNLFTNVSAAELVAEAALARNATNLTSGTVADARLPSTSNNVTISAISTVANAALPKAGGTMTGDLVVPIGNLKPSGSGGANLVVKQASSGGALSVAALVDGDIPAASNAAAIALKAPLASPTFSGTVTTPGVTLTGNYLVLANTFGCAAASDASYVYYCGGLSAGQVHGAYIAMGGNGFLGNMWLYPSSDSGSNIQINDYAGTLQVKVDAGGLKTNNITALSGSLNINSNVTLSGNLSSGASGGVLVMGGRSSTDGTDGAATRLHADNHATYPGALHEFSALDSRAASTAFSLCPVATGDVAEVTILDDAAGTTNARVRVDSAGTVTFVGIAVTGIDSDPKYVNSSSPSAAQVGVYITAGVLICKPGSGLTIKIASISHIGKA